MTPVADSVKSVVMYCSHVSSDVVVSVVHRVMKLVVDSVKSVVMWLCQQ